MKQKRRNVLVCRWFMFMVMVYMVKVLVWWIVILAKMDGVNRGLANLSLFYDIKGIYGQMI